MTRTDITEVTILHHVGLVLVVIWMLTLLNCCNSSAYFISFVYLYLVHDRYFMRLKKTLQFEERRQNNQRRVLCESESVRWLNLAVEKIWPVCMEQIVSQKILLPIIPWFLQKYKPWTAREAVVQSLYMGRSPPVFTEMRVVRQSNGDDHLVLELGMNFRAADDMSAILSVKLRKRLGFGMVTKLHLTGLHVEGKVLLGVKFLNHWPFLGRLRLCFAEPPYFQMIVKPIFSRGLDVTELPGIAGWLDNLLARAFEQTLVEPNMLVVDMKKFVSPEKEPWFSVDEKEPVAYALVEVVEAVDMKPSDLNGLADPYVKGTLGQYRFRTKTQKKTLSPKWHEEFKVPICTWESPNTLSIEVRDKDHFVDDTLGDCSVNITELRGGERNDMWLPLQNIKMGRLHLVITVIEKQSQATDTMFEDESLNEDSRTNSFTDPNQPTQNGSFSSKTSNKHSPMMVDKLEPIDINHGRQGGGGTGIWIVQPGSETPETWEPRKGRRSGRLDRVESNEMASFKSGSARDSPQNNSKNKIMRGLAKISGVINNRIIGNNNKDEETQPVIPSPRHVNLKAVKLKQVNVKLVMDEDDDDDIGIEDKRNVKGMAKGIMKHAERSARGLKNAILWKGSRIRGETASSTASPDRDFSVDSESNSDEKEPQIAYGLGNTDMLLLRVELKTSRLLNGCSNQLSYKSRTSIVGPCSSLDVD